MRDSLECPNCQRKLTAPPDDTIEAVCCPACGTTFRLKEPEPAPESSLTVSCPACGGSLVLRTDLSDPWDRCPHCKTVFPHAELVAFSNKPDPVAPIGRVPEHESSTEWPVAPGEAEVLLQKSPDAVDRRQADDSSKPDINPVSRIARKRSFILRYLEPDLPRTRRMERAFIIGACIPATLACVCCVFSPPPKFDWCMILPLLATCVACGFIAFLFVGFSYDTSEEHRSAFWILRQQLGDPTNKGENVADNEEKTNEAGITPSPSQAAIRPDPKPEEPTEA